MTSFRKSEACGQTVLPDTSILKGQKLLENAKIENLKCDILAVFQTLFVHALWCRGPGPQIKLLLMICHNTVWILNKGLHFILQVCIFLTILQKRRRPSLRREMERSIDVIASIHANCSSAYDTTLTTLCPRMIITSLMVQDRQLYSTNKSIQNTIFRT